MVSLARAAILGAALFFYLAPVRAHGQSCGMFPSTGTAPAPQRRPLEPADLARLRNLGPPVVFPGERVFELSPDGTRIAFQVTRPEPSSNRICIGMFVLALTSGARPVRIDEGGELLLRLNDVQGMIGVPTGAALTVTPRWSPDGRSVAFLKRSSGGATQIWLAQADGSGSAQATRSDVDVEDFAFANDGTAIVYRSRPGLLAARDAIADEAMHGFHYDDRYFPVASARPFPRGPIPAQTFRLDLSTGRAEPAGQSERALLDGVASGAPAGSRSVTRSPSGQLAWTMADESAGASPSNRLYAQDEAARIVRCEATSCANVGTMLGWSERGVVRFLAREGWADSEMAIYAWTPGPAAPRRLTRTDGYLVDCRPANDALVCAEEAATTPRRLVRLDPATGRSTLLFDPNPEFASLTLGRVERLRATSMFGVPTWLDLVYPVGYRPGRRYPVVVVQYISRGFLNGGTGEEFPIQAFANRGYAVLSLQRPSSDPLAPGARDWVEASRRNLVGFRDRRNVLSVIETAVNQLIERGIADPARIGITGLSDGSSTVQFAALNSRLFAAGAASGCCWEPMQAALLGPAVARHYADVGWPGLTENRADFWSDISLARNARRVAFPLLLQAADSEYLGALESFTALREAGAPAELYVFPGDFHIKWQPAHKLAAWERSLDWFDFWLRGIENETPGRPDEYARWRDMRARRETRVQQAGGPTPDR